MEALSDPTKLTHEEYTRAVAGKRLVSDDLDQKGVGWALRRKYLKK
jgi:hypothetical protein